MLRMAVVLITCLLCSVVPGFAQRLPVGVVPSHYDLTVAPDLAAATFTGNETIAVSVEKPTSTIVLNAAEIDFNRVTVTAAGQALERIRSCVALSDAQRPNLTTWLDRMGNGKW